MIAWVSTVSGQGRRLPFVSQTPTLPTGGAAVGLLLLLSLDAQRPLCLYRIRTVHTPLTRKWS